MMLKAKRLITAVLAFMMCAGLFAGIGVEAHAEDSGAETSAQTEGKSEKDLTFDDFSDAKIGVLTGSAFIPILDEYFPDAERSYYTTRADLILSVEQGKIDGFLCDNIFFTPMLWEGANVDALDETIELGPIAYALSSEYADSELLEQINEFTLKSEENGVLDQLTEKWLGEDEPSAEDDIDYSRLTGENGTLSVAVDTDSKPLAYLRNGKYTGLEVELLVMFAEEYGYALELNGMAFDAALSGISSGRYDIAAAGFTVTEERKQSMVFSEPHIESIGLMVIKGDGSSAQKMSFWESILDSFEKTFIREERWKSILSGIGVTMIISAFSAVFGSLLGFGLYLMARSKYPAVSSTARGIGKVYSRILSGTPTVVILMIFYYVVFGSVKDISGILVAVVAFSLKFSSFVYSHLVICVGNVDKGQTEAAYSLGYDRNKTFFRIILPQSMILFLPTYCGQAVSLVLETAVVGYIAVNDLTRVGDVIRSSTFEAFFPLIAVAVIYFVLTCIIAMILKRINIRFDPKQRGTGKILKGIDVR